MQIIISILAIILVTIDIIFFMSKYEKLKKVNKDLNEELEIKKKNIQFLYNRLLERGFSYEELQKEKTS